MVALGKMNKAELIARVQELEKELKDLINDGAKLIVAEKKENGELQKKNKELQETIEELEEDVYDPDGSGEKCVDILNNYREEMEKIEEFFKNEMDIEIDDITDIIPKWKEKWSSFSKTEIIENYFADEKLRETTWKEWNDQQKYIGNLKKFLGEEQERVSAFQTYMNVRRGWDIVYPQYQKIDQPERLTENFNKWVAGKTGVQVKKGKDFHLKLEEDAITGELVLKVLPNRSVKIEEWEELMESGDSDPELLLDAIAEKFNLTPIDWGKPGCKDKSYELWEKIADIMTEP